MDTYTIRHTCANHAYVYDKESLDAAEDESLDLDLAHLTSNTSKMQMQNGKVQVREPGAWSLNFGLQLPQF